MIPSLSEILHDVIKYFYGFLFLFKMVAYFIIT